ncbi:MAG TPA: molybdopterin-dependent oxidoreductase, partial [Bacteroidota bacterium]|nr:molybdopterin-dependent oxidoreductase [Bacteroidota bacterium]
MNSFGKAKLPPGQYKTEKFPVLTYGNVPAVSTKDWKFEVWGLVEPRQWTWDEFMKLPQSKIQADFHCVTHWSRFGDVWSGVMF